MQHSLWSLLGFGYISLSCSLNQSRFQQNRGIVCTPCQQTRYRVIEESKTNGEYSHCDPRRDRERKELSRRELCTLLPTWWALSHNNIPHRVVGPGAWRDREISKTQDKCNTPISIGILKMLEYCHEETDEMINNLDGLVSPTSDGLRVRKVCTGYTIDKKEREKFDWFDWWSTLALIRIKNQSYPGILTTQMNSLLKPVEQHLINV